MLVCSSFLIFNDYAQFIVYPAESTFMVCVDFRDFGFHIVFDKRLFLTSSNKRHC